MSSWWQSWVDRCGVRVDSRALAALRIGVAAVALLDLLRVWQLGLVRAFYVDFENGGLSGFSDPFLVIDSSWMGPWLYWATLLALLCVLLGLGTRGAILAAVLLWAQLGHLYPPGDRAIDRILRTVLLFLLFSASHRRWSLSRAPPVDSVGAWPLLLVRWLLFLVYTSAGIAKLAQQPGWLAIEGTPVLYRLLTDPMAAHLDPVAATEWWWLLRPLGWGTIVLELTAVLLLTRWDRLWIPVAITMHVGIAMTMNLGMFSYGMLALYVPLTAEWWLPGLDRSRRTVV